MSSPLRWMLPLAGALAALTAASLFTVDAREVAVVSAFGRPVRTITAPGLQLRLPWPIHEVVRFDARARLLEVPPAELLTRDKKNLVIEALVIWRVADPVRFLEAVGGDAAAEVQLSDLAVSRIAAALGQRDFSDLISVDTERTALLPEALTAQLGQAATARLGVEVLRVQISHVGFPLQNQQSIYERMRAERLRIANAYRSEGAEKAAVIRAQADRQAAELLAAAERDGAMIRARAEGAAARLYTEAHARDPEFYRFLRRLEATEAVLDEQAVIVLDADSALLAPLQATP